MDHINLDYESRSRIDLKKHGFDRYSGDGSTQILMGAWTENDGAMNFWDATRQKRIPANLRDALRDPKVLKWGFNAQFERVMTERVLGIKTDPASWRCTMVLSYMLGFAGDLGLVGRSVGLPADKQKLADGKRLINLFCKPRKPTKAKPYEWADEVTDPEDWDFFGGYNRQDVVTESLIKRRLQAFPVLDSEWELYAFDQYINDTGIYINRDFAHNAIEIAERRKPVIIEEMRDITGLANPNSPTQLLRWLRDHGYPFEDLRADTVKKVIKEIDFNGAEAVVADVLGLRQNSAKSSLKKYQTMLDAVGEDSRFRYSLQFWGAQRTGRWAGRRLQTHNLPRTPKYLEPVEDLEIVNKMILNNDLEAISLYVKEPMDALVGCIRSALMPAPKHKFVVADLASIESVVIGWLTDCQWFLNTLREGHDLYRSFAAEWLGLPYEETKPHRPKAKPATLGAGYRLGGGEMSKDGKKTGLWGYAENMGVEMTKVEAHASVKAFRDLCPEIVQSWYDLERAVFRCIKTRLPVKWRSLTIEFRKPFLCIVLPSGRRLYYFKPKIVSREMVGKDGKKYTKDNFQYEGKAEGANNWGTQFSHGGKLVENIVQAIARDILVEGQRNARAKGFNIVLHVHDEIIAEVPINDTYLTPALLVECMAAKISWAPGLPLGAEAWEGYFYRKG